MTPAMVANWRSSGVATEAAIVSGLAPGQVGRDLDGRKIDPRQRRHRQQAIAEQPAPMNEIISRVVMTGRRMQSSGRLMKYVPAGPPGRLAGLRPWHPGRDASVRRSRPARRRARPAAITVLPSSGAIDRDRPHLDGIVRLDHEHVGPFWPDWIASEGTTMAAGSTLSVTTTLTNCPARGDFCSFGKLALTEIVLVAGIDLVLEVAHLSRSRLGLVAGDRRRDRERAVRHRLLQLARGSARRRENAT